MSTPDVRQAPLPCPFCGHDGPLDFSEGSTFRWLAYSCGGCGVGNETRVQTLGDGTPEQWRAKAEQDAIAEWNNRIPARAALSEPPKAGAGEGWQPIETAPKTGRKVILFYLNRNKLPRTVMARWLTDEQAAESDGDGVGLEGGWYECIDNWDSYTEVAIHEGEPSHWMPLPAAPKPEDTK